MRKGDVVNMISWKVWQPTIQAGYAAPKGRAGVFLLLGDADKKLLGEFCPENALRSLGWIPEDEAAPTPPQPIYDESKERELFEAYCEKVGLPTDTIPSGEYLIPATRFMSQGWHARAKAVEVGHE